MKNIKWIAFLMAAVLFAGSCPKTVQAATYEEVIETKTVTADIDTSARMLNMLSLEDGIVEMKDSSSVEWIDRIKSLPEEVQYFYKMLEEATDNDGNNDFLIDDKYFLQTNYVPAGAITMAESVVLNETLLNETLTPYFNYMFAVIGAFDRDHPEVFWLDRTYSLSASCFKDDNGNYAVTPKLIVYDKRNNLDLRTERYRGESLIKAAIAERDAKVKEIVSSVENGSDYEKIKHFNQILTKTNEYNTSIDLQNIASECRSCMSALRGKIGTSGPVCEGYARAFNVLCDKVGIPCVLVDGTANGAAHMWNYVQLEEKWYAVDITWNDPKVTAVSGAESGYESEDWLLVGADTLIYEEKFIDSHPISNSPFPGLAFINGPELHTIAYHSTINLQNEKNSAKEELKSLLKNEYENIGEEVVKSCYIKIDNCNSKEDIDLAVQECKNHLANYVDENITYYRETKCNRINKYVESLEEKLRNDYENLVMYVTEILPDLYNAKNKKEVDNAYNTLLDKIDNKVIELTNKSEITTDNDGCREGIIGENCPSRHFIDLAQGSWYHLNVDYVVSNKLMVGIGDNVFGAETPVTRAMIVTILYRMSDEKVEQQVIEQCKFEDVPKGQYYTDAVAWAASKNIVAGMSEIEFAPNNEITREQMVAMLRRYAGYLGYGTNESIDLSKFADSASVSNWAVDDMKWASSVNMISGSQENGRTYLNPKGQTLRVQAAAFVHRFCEKYSK